VKKGQQLSKYMSVPEMKLVELKFLKISLPVKIIYGF
jgi:hypothetical protein